MRVYLELPGRKDLDALITNKGVIWCGHVGLKTLIVSDDSGSVGFVGHAVGPWCIRWHVMSPNEKSVIVKLRGLSTESIERHLDLLGTVVEATGFADGDVWVRMSGKGLEGDLVTLRQLMSIDVIEVNYIFAWRDARVSTDV